MTTLPGLALAVATGGLGLAVSRRLPRLLSGGERALVGLVVAIVAVVAAGYLLSLGLGLDSRIPAWLAVLCSVAMVGFITPDLAGASPTRALSAVVALLRDRRVVALGAGLVILGAGLAFLFARAVEVTPSGWLTRYPNVWSDWAFHASSSTTFAYGQNFPPENPLFAGYPFRYPFAPDFASALLVAGGWSLPAALVWPSWLMAALALSGVVLWGRRLSGSVIPGALAVTLTLLGGGLGFWLFLQDAARLGLAEVLQHPPQSYDHVAAPWNIQWANPILSYYLPQRSFVFGAAVFVTVLLVLTPVVLPVPATEGRQVASALPTRTRLSAEAGLLLLGGALMGLLPWFHVHTLLALGVVAVGWAFLSPRPAWLACFALAALLALPRLLFAVPGDPGAPAELHYPRLQLGWVAGPQGPFLFWLTNTGAFWPLLLVALFSPLALTRRSRLLLLPFLAVFVVANLVVFQPWDWDNTKVLVYWYLAGAVAVGALLLRLWRAGWPGRLTAAAAWVSLIATGVVSLVPALLPSAPAYIWFSSEEIALADTVRLQTPPHAVFLTGDRPANPVADLAGRTVLMGYRGWLWTFGIDYRSREIDVTHIYRGDVHALELLRRYGISYVVVGPDELANWQANPAFFEARFALLTRTANYQVFTVSNH